MLIPQDGKNTHSHDVCVWSIERQFIWNIMIMNYIAQTNNSIGNWKWFFVCYFYCLNFSLSSLFVDCWIWLWKTWQVNSEWYFLQLISSVFFVMHLKRSRDNWSHLTLNDIHYWQLNRLTKRLNRITKVQLFVVFISRITASRLPASKVNRKLGQVIYCYLYIISWSLTDFIVFWTIV